MNRKERRRQEKRRRKTGGPKPEIVPVLDAAFAHQQAGDLDRAVALYTQALDIDPAYGPALNNLGAALKDLGRLDDAAQQHRAAIAANPKDADAHYNLGLVAEAQGRTADAEGDYRAALALNANDAGALNNLGALMVGDGRAEEAAPLLQRAAELAPDQAEILNNLGAALVETGRPDDATGHLGRALAINPDYDEAHHNLGAALIGLGRMEDAVQCFERAIAINPAHANAHVNRGIALMADGNAEDAHQAFRSAAEIDSGNVAAGHMVAAMSGETTAAAPAELVRALFDLYARRFDEHLVDDLGYRIPSLMAEAVGGLDGAPARFARGLDLGCGTGLVAVSFRERVAYLEGVDLAPKMVAKAREKGLYDALHVGELVAHLKGAAAGTAFELVLAADTFIYIGDLAGVFDAVAAVMATGGLFAFSVERADSGPYELRHSGRYGHGDDYVTDLAAARGFSVRAHDPVTVRTEFGQPIAGSLFVLEKD